MGERTAGWREGMRGFYRALEAEQGVAAAACRGCGACCHFEKAEHILYASELERRYLAATTAAVPNPDGTRDLLERGLRCPFQEKGLCTAREGRPLGCRLHFCGDASSEKAEEWHDRLKRLHEELGVAWEYRPLLPWRPRT